MKNIGDKIVEENQVLKPQKWEELTDKEKIEGVKENLDNAETVFFEYISKLNSKINLLKKHFHLPDGTVAVKYQDIYEDDNFI